MREKILEMVDLLVSPFDSMIETIAIDGMEGIEADLVPEPIKQLHAFLKTTLGAARATYEDAMVAVVSQHLTEADVDAVLAFNKSETGKKMRAIAMTIQDELSHAAAKWRNDTLEPHVDEVKKMMGVEEPGPAIETLDDSEDDKEHAFVPSDPNEINEAKPPAEEEVSNEPLPPIDPPTAA